MEEVAGLEEGGMVASGLCVEAEVVVCGRGSVGVAWGGMGAAGGVD